MYSTMQHYIGYLMMSFVGVVSLGMSWAWQQPWQLRHQFCYQFWYLRSLLLAAPVLSRSIPQTDPRPRIHSRCLPCLLDLLVPSCSWQTGGRSGNHGTVVQPHRTTTAAATVLPRASACHRTQG
jgi:hypothetical protein